MLGENGVFGKLDSDKSYSTVLEFHGVNQHCVLNRCLHTEAGLSIDHLMKPLIRGLQELALCLLEEWQLILVSSVCGHLIEQTTTPSPRFYRVRGFTEQRTDGALGTHYPTSLEASAGNSVYLR